MDFISFVKAGYTVSQSFTKLMYPLSDIYHIFLCHPNHICAQSPVSLFSHTCSMQQQQQSYRFVLFSRSEYDITRQIHNLLSEYGLFTGDGYRALLNFDDCARSKQPLSELRNSIIRIDNDPQTRTDLDPYYKRLLLESRKHNITLFFVSPEWFKITTYDMNYYTAIFFDKSYWTLESIQRRMDETLYTRLVAKETPRWIGMEYHLYTNTRMV